VGQNSASARRNIDLLNSFVNACSRFCRFCQGGFRKNHEPEDGVLSNLAGRDDSVVVNDSTIRRKQAFLCYDKDEQPKGNPVKFIADALTEFLKESIRKAEFGL